MIYRIVMAISSNNILHMCRLVPALVDTSFINTCMIHSSRENIPEQTPRYM